DEVVIRRVASRTNVAVRERGALATTECALASPSLHDCHSYRASGVSSGCGGASSQWGTPSSHQNIVRAAIDTLSTNTVRFPGLAPMETWCCFTKRAVTVRSLSAVI